MSFRLKTILGIIAIEGLLLAFIIWFGLNSMHQINEAELVKRSTSIASLLASAARDAVLATDLSTLDGMVQETMKNPGMIYARVVDSSGVALGQAGDKKALARPFVADSYIDDVTDGVFDTLAPIVVNDIQYGRVQLGFSVVHIYEALVETRRQVIGIAMAEIFVLAALSFFFGSYLTRQIEGLRKASQRIAEGDLGYQVPVVGNDELAQTARAFNTMSCTLKEIHDEKARHEEALQKSEERFHLAVAGSNDGIWDWDITAGQIYLSPRWKQMLGYEEDEIENSFIAWRDLIHTDDLGKFLDAWTVYTEGNSDGFTIEYRLRRKDGDYAWILCRGQRARTSQNNTMRLAGSHSDISVRKKAETALRESETRIRAIVEAAADGIITIDEQGIVESINTTAEGIFGYTREEVCGQNVSMLMPLPDSERHDDYLRRYRQTGLPGILKGGSREVTGRRSDGSTFPMELSASEVWLDNKRIFIGLTRDISERKQVQENLDRTRGRLQYLLDNIPAVVYTAVPTGDFKITFITENVLHVLGYESAEVIDDPNFLFEHIHEDDRIPMVARLQHLFRDSEQVHEYRIKQKNGEYIWVHDTLRVVKGKDGELLEITGSLMDITARKKAEKDVAEARDQALEANKLKSEFLANMSHELRTPLNSVIGFSGMLIKGIDGKLNDEQESSLTLINNSGKHLLELINDILDLSKIEAGKMELAREPTDLEEMINTAIETVSPLAKEKKLDLGVELISDLPVLLIDGLRIKQVLINLLSNAIKFTDQGGVYVHSKRIDGMERRLPAEVKHLMRKSEPTMMIEVRDTGVGISSEDLSRVFEAFKQVDGSSTRRHGGTGLGLTIAKRFVEMHGGHMWLESQEGQGTSFLFTLPILTGVPKEDGTPLQDRVENMRQTGTA